MIAVLSHKIDSLTTYTEQIRDEFIRGSCIDAELFVSAVSLVADLEELPGGDVSTPIHDALNWRYTRFGHQIRQAMFAALLLNEDGSTWQAKLSHPRHNAKGKIQKYEAPLGAGSTAYLPEVPLKFRLKIRKRYGAIVPLRGSFWNWLEKHPEIPVIWTEGGKKALSLLSEGFVAIALYGVNGGYRKQVDGSRTLIADVERFAQPGRSHLLAFDQDEKKEVRRQVSLALFRFGGLLEQAEGQVSLLLWNGAIGKGVDDLIANSGAEAFEKVYAEALPFLHWKLQERLSNQLTYAPHIRLSTADLSTLLLSNLPESGIIAIASSKGTGKTKFISSLVSDIEAVLSATHRVALGRNLCSRLGLNWRGDLDKVGGKFISGSGYTLRVGFCVDSLLSINPETFAGCDLVLDEVCQVVRHLLTSSTCAKDGKRPALLARFRELLSVARRVIIADADLDNATLSYLKELRDYQGVGAENQDRNIFLIKNDYQSEGYPCRFLEAPDRTAITAEILEAVDEAKPGQVVFIATDSKGMSKSLATGILNADPSKKVMVINSETSGGEIEREFMQSPDRSLLEGCFDVVIVSPSMATGVSIEAQSVISKVFGVFTGGSSNDADMSQALGRVREGVERIVWCAKVGSNYSKVSRSALPSEFREHLQASTAATVRLVRSNLREDIAGEFEAYDWRVNPHLDLFCRLSSEQNFSMRYLRQALLVRLKAEGNQVQIEKHNSNPAIKLLLSEIRSAQREIDAEELVAAEDLQYADLLALEQKEVMSPEEHKAIAKHYFKEFYALEELSIFDVLWDNEGRRRGELLALEVQLEEGLAIERTIKALEKQASWGKGACPWDVSTIELKRALRERLGFNELIVKITEGWEWTIYDLKPYADKARELSELSKIVLNFSIHERVTDTQIIHQLLRQMGIEVEMLRFSSIVPGHEGQKLRVYGLKESHWEIVSSVLSRRKAKREAFLALGDSAGSPSGVSSKLPGGDPEVSLWSELLLEAINYGSEPVLDLYAGVPEAIRESVLLALPSVLREILKFGRYQPPIPVVKL
ncbi:MAG: DUF3854 domain-containing protein [Drouetiella hepatica Uher 2000/2452]|jgi:hypothetical protein|uniref:DUF3854 domain-containing protein n=1 Tax=Drouetiella hepatica Uher 2000/2452 TaxID=904376 RepID=A0A951QD56_9CYAN|nr:DUF3854 domain-containing protein [Drouetiella hepatica Uher 2000/2452]